MTPPPDLADKDALIATLLARIEALTATNALLMARVTELEAKLGLPPKTPDNSSVPPSKGQKPSEPATPKDKAKPHAGLIVRFIPIRLRSAMSLPAAAKDAARMSRASCKAHARPMTASKSPRSSPT